MTRKVGTVTSIRNSDLTMNTNIKDHMLAYLEKGFSVIPIGIDKKPLISAWKEYQSRKPTKEDIINWCSTLSPYGIGIVTGKISRIVVLDVDVGADTSGLELPPTSSVKTGGGGWHYYYKYSFDVILSSYNGFRHKMDFKAEGGYVIAPPSTHQSGKNYEWAVPFENTNNLAEIPDWLLQEIKNKRERPALVEIIKGVPKGNRNETTATLVGKLLHYLPPQEHDAVWQFVDEWNRLNKPPLDFTELRRTFESILKYNVEKSNDTFNIESWKNFDQKEFPKERWWIDGLIPKNSLVILAAPSGERKSWLALEMAKCIISGTQFLNHFETKKARVLYIEQETAQWEIQRRGRQLGIPREEDFSLLSQDELNLNVPGTVDRLFNVITERKIEVVFVDTFRSVGGGIHEDKGEEIRAFFSRFKSWKDHGITIVFLDHCRKPRLFENAQTPKKDQLIGSQDKTASVETLHMMRSKERSDEITFYPMKMRVGRELPPFRININDQKDGETTATILSYAGEIDEHQLKKDDAKESILTHLEDETEKKGSKEIIKVLNGKCGKTAIEDALKEMREENIIGWEKVGGKYLYWDKEKICEDNNVSLNKELPL